MCGVHGTAAKVGALPIVFCVASSVSVLCVCVCTRLVHGLIFLYFAITFLAFYSEEENTNAQI